MKCGRHPPERPVRAERTGWGGLADRCSSGSAGAHAHPLALAVTLAPPHPLGRATGPGREGPTGRGDTPYTARPALPGLGPGRSFFGQRRGPGRGPRPRAGWGTGLQCPTPKYGSRRGATFLRGGAGGGAPAGYIKPEREDQRPPQRTAPREASLPSRGDQGPSRRAAGVATRPGRAGVGEGAGDRRTIGQGDKVTGHHRGEPGELRGRTQPTHLISPKACFLPAHPVAWSSEPHALYRGGPRPSALGNISKFIPSPFGLLYLAFRMCRVD